MIRNPEDHDVACGALDPWPTACDCAPIAKRAATVREGDVDKHGQARPWRSSVAAFLARLTGKPA